MKIQTRDEDGEPICPMCSTEVAEPGQFCTPAHYEHFTTVVSNQSGIVEMENYIDPAEQPWSGFEDDVA